MVRPHNESLVGRHPESAQNCKPVSPPGELHVIPVSMSRQVFGTTLNSLVSPALPIQSIEFLQGRGRELDRIEKALFAAGRHIFIYGDRGVGKSSLAATAANQLQSSDAPYIDVSGAPDATLRSIVANIAYKAVEASRIHKTKLKATANASFRFLGASLGARVSTESSIHNLHSEIKTLGDAVEVLREVSELYSERTLIVLDEFDRIAKPTERNLFADLLKQLADKKVPITFMFTGVGKFLTELLGAHPSSIRQLETIELQKLRWDARWDIATRASESFGIALDEQVKIRIAAVSDGYPYYVHLIAEKMLWRAFEADSAVSVIEPDLYLMGLKDAIEGINAELKAHYDQAVTHQAEEFAEVLWAAADSDFLDRTQDDVFTSYGYVMEQRAELHRVSVDRLRFAAIMAKLKSKACGPVLMTTTVNSLPKKGWISFRENLLRGFVRMQAEANGVELLGLVEAPPDPQSKTYYKKPRHNASMVPRGVHMGRRRG
jgi:hypothetical protein